MMSDIPNHECEYQKDGLCPVCERIAELENRLRKNWKPYAEMEAAQKRIAELEDKYNSALEERNAYKLRADQRPALKQRIAALNMEKAQSDAGWAREVEKRDALLDEILALPRYHNITNTYCMERSEQGLWYRCADVRNVTNKREQTNDRGNTTLESIGVRKSLVP